MASRFLQEVRLKFAEHDWNGRSAPCLNNQTPIDPLAAIVEYHIATCRPVLMQVFRNYNSKKHFFTYYSYIVRSDSDKFSRFLDIFLALSPVRVEVGGVTSHQIEAIFEAFDILKEKEMEQASKPSSELSETSQHLPRAQNSPESQDTELEEAIGAGSLAHETTWPVYIENFKFALAEKECREVLMYEFKKSQETGKRKRLRKSLLEALDAKGVVPQHDRSEELRLQALKIGKRGPADMWMM